MFDSAPDGERAPYESEILLASYRLRKLPQEIEDIPYRFWRHLPAAFNRIAACDKEDS